MKRIIVLLIAVLCAGTLLAQETPVRSKSQFNSDRQTYKKISIGTDFTYDLWQDMPKEIKRKGFNRSSSFFGTYNFQLGKSNFYACPGLGFNFRNIYADALLQRDTVTGIAYVPVPLPKKDYKKAKTLLSYIELPIDLRYSYKRFQAGIGVKVSCNIGVMSKYKGKQFAENGMAGTSVGSNIKEKWMQVPDAERFQFGAQVRIGYSWIHAYGYYSLTKVFKSSTDIEMYPISVGISVMPFR
jgi:hypothetical protein